MTYSVREQRSWYAYDWANSVFASTVLTLFFGPYITSIARAAADAAGRIHPLGIAVDPRAYWSYLISLSVVTQVICLPILGAIADFSPRKKTLLGATAFTGATATIAMFFVTGVNYLLGGALFLAANLAFGASMVLYNSYLPQIAPEAQRDAVSSKGWGIGYLGGGLMLALNLLLYKNTAALGITEAFAVRVSLASAGLWWALFTLIPMAGLRERPPLRRLAPGESAVTSGFRHLRQTILELRHYPQTVTFLIAFLIYNDAIQAVITLAAQFGHDELGVPMQSLTGVILMVQFVAFAGALFFNALARILKAKRALVVSLVIWTLVICAMYGIVRDERGFWIAAAVVALVLGGSQALSRSLFSLMIPKGKEAEYFSVYEISDKGTSWIAPLLFGLALQFTGSYRVAILSLLFFFAAGLAVLLRVNVGRAAREAGNEAP